MEHTQNEVSLTLKGQIMPSTPTRKISDFVDPGDTPGNVAICISGGGSVSMMSTLGQLRALKQMGVLDKARCISTVSGGSWATVLFTFLKEGIKDEELLGTYVEDISSLRMKVADCSDQALALEYMPDNYMGRVVADAGMKAESLAYEAKCLSSSGFPKYKIWNYLIARHILEPVGLAETDQNSFDMANKKDCDGDQTQRYILPSWFAFNETQQKSILSNNQDLNGIACHLYCKEGVDNIKRPYHLCNTSMFITPNLFGAMANQDGNMLASVQSTAIGTGIFAQNLGVPDGSDKSNAQQVGGGLISSYAFNSTNVNTDGNEFSAEVQKEDLFSLTDITANSSAFFATAITQLSGLDPSYNYWSPQQQNPASFFTKFADGGSIEDNGLLNALAYDDIDKAVVFVNALKSMSLDGSTVSNDFMNVIVDTWIPTYFGYTPYQDQKKADKHKIKKGYNLYSQLDESGFDYSDAGFRFFRHNQIFDSSLFPQFLEKLWKNSNGYSQPSVFHETLTVLDNEWFGINGRDVELMIVHYGPFKGFMDKLDKKVRYAPEILKYIEENKIALNAFDGDNPVHGMFPNYIITETHMPSYMLNLLAHFTCHVAMTQADKIQAMFKD